MPTYYCSIAISYGRISSFVGSVSLATIATIAVDRFLAFHLRLRYKEIVRFRRVVCVLVLKWILAALWVRSWFWSAKFNLIWGTIALLSFCLITSFCYLSIYRGLRHHVVQIHQQANFSESNDFNVLQYKKTVCNMLWICGLLLVCYIPYLLSLLAILITGVNSSTRFVLHFSAVAINFNSSLNPVLYCWRIKELKGKVTAAFLSLCKFFLSL